MCDEKDRNFGATTTGSFITTTRLPAHTSLKNTQFLTNNNMVIVPHPPYSSDLAPCDFALFPKLKMKLKGRRFETVSDIQRKSQAVLDSIQDNDFHGTFQAWRKRWDCCICSQGDYFEGDGIQN
jgi:transposase